MNDLERLFAIAEAYTARDAGMTPEQWRDLPAAERTRLEEDIEDCKFACDQHMTLVEYRARRRRQIEKGVLACGIPQWLRDAYAAERPVEVAVEYLRLLTEGAAAHGPTLTDIVRTIQGRTRRGWIYTEGMSFEDAKALLLEEIDRAGLRGIFDEAKAQQAERADQ